ncbi:hypothetical protein FACS1894201_06630 [Bacteroidia bacterium]|nr:hypothetical protein FACS1894201_06630 [Bacteroidia bacterium]
MNKIVFILSCALLMVCTSCTKTERKFATIRVEVSDKETGDAVVKAMLNTYPEIQHQETDSNGVAVFQNLDAGEYTIYVNHKDYGYDHTPVKAARGVETPVFFQLQKK